VLGVGAARRAGVKPGMPGVEFTDYAGGVGSYRREEWIGRFDEFRIADEKITHTRLRISDLGRAHADMLVGADFFLSHRVYVSKLQHRMYFTYNGGPVFDLRHGSDPARAAEIESDEGSAGEPADAESFSRRSLVRAARGDTQGALADAIHASELAPEEPQYIYFRAAARLGAGQRAQALEDLDSVILKEPAYVPALLTRASMRVEDRQFDLAVPDLDAAERMVMGQADVRLQPAALYRGAGRLDPALVQLDRWIGAHADDSKMSYALGLRCRIHALQGSDLDKARSDCSESLRLAEDVPEVMDSRALVTLRSGDFDHAIRQYDAALEKKPDLAWSLYGRGLAKLKNGQAAKGQADIDAAKAADPKIADDAVKYGIAP
jgi:tetratricopeptide (TPR) repeat protein